MKPTDPLLITKLRPPPARADRVARPRLEALLREGLTRPLTLVVAPAGFGKTTLLSAWCAALRDAGAGVAWVSLDAGDSDPARFWAYVIAGIQHAYPGCGARALGLLRTPQPSAAEGALRLLLNDLAALPGELVLALDDYHAVGEGQVDRGVAFLLEHLPPNVHLLIDARAEPSLPLNRLRARDQLVELSAADLRFSADEAAELLRRELRQEIAPGHAAVLAERVEGWAAGLHMAALAARGRADAGQLIASFGGGHRFVLDYLAGEVIGGQPEYVRRFLLRTSVLDRMCADLCDALLADAGQGAQPADAAQWMLEEIERRNLFLVPLDDERRWYRYHHLFAETLRARLRQTSPELLPELHRRAYRWYAARTPGDYESISAAIGHALAAGEVDGAATLIEPAINTTLWQRGEIGTLRGWLRQLPDEALRSHPRVALASVWVLFLEGDLSGAAERFPAELAVPDADAAVRDEARLLGVILAMLRDDTQAMALLTQLPTTAHPTPFLASVIAITRAVAPMLRGELAEAAEHFTEAIRLAHEAGALIVAIVALSQLAELRLFQGRLRQAAETYRQGMVLGEAVDEANGPAPLPPMARQLATGYAEVLREWGELDEATRLLEANIVLTDTSQALWSFDGLVALARIHGARGDFAQAHGLLDRVERHSRRLGLTPAATIAGAYRVRLWLAQGDLLRAARWQPTLDRSALLAQVYELETLTQVQVMIAQGQGRAAVGLLEEVLAMAEPSGRNRSVVEALVLLALARAALGDAGAAREALLRVLHMAEPEGYVRVFADAGPGVARLLAALPGERGALPGGDAMRRYVERLLAAFPPAAAERAGAAPELPRSPGGAPQQPAEALSERELEVLRLVGSGLSNRDVAERLIMAESTVKWYLKSIFAKLEAKSRTQAVARARELSLI